MFSGSESKPALPKAEEEGSSQSPKRRSYPDRNIPSSSHANSKSTRTRRSANDIPITTADKENMNPAVASTTSINSFKQQHNKTLGSNVVTTASARSNTSSAETTPLKKPVEITVRFSDRAVAKRSFADVMATPEQQPAAAQLMSARFTTLQDGDEDKEAAARNPPFVLNKLGWQMEDESSSADDMAADGSRILYSYEDIKRMSLSGPLLSKLEHINESNKHLLYNNVAWLDHMESFRLCQQDRYKDLGRRIEAQCFSSKLHCFDKIIRANASISDSLMTSPRIQQEVTFCPERQYELKAKAAANSQKSSAANSSKPHLRSGKLVPNVPAPAVNVVISPPTTESTNPLLRIDDWHDMDISELLEMPPMSEAELLNFERLIPDTLSHSSATGTTGGPDQFNLNTILPDMDLLAMTNLGSNSADVNNNNNSTNQVATNSSSVAQTVIFQEAHELSKQLAESTTRTTHQHTYSLQLPPSDFLKDGRGSMSVPLKLNPKSETRMRAEKLIGSDPRFHHYADALATMTVLMLCKTTRLNKLYYDYLIGVYETSSCNSDAAVRRCITRLQNKRAQLEREISAKWTLKSCESVESLKPCKFITEMLMDKLGTTLLTTTSIFSELLLDKPSSIFDPAESNSSSRSQGAVKSLTSHVMRSDVIQLLMDFYALFKRLKERFLLIEGALLSSKKPAGHSGEDLSSLDFHDLSEFKLQFHDLLTCLLNSPSDKSTMDTLLAVLKPVELLVLGKSSSAPPKDPRRAAAKETEVDLKIIPAYQQESSSGPANPQSKDGGGGGGGVYNESEYVRGKYFGFKSRELERLNWPASDPWPTSPTAKSNTSIASLSDDSKPERGTTAKQESTEDDTALLKSFGAPENQHAEAESNQHPVNDTLMIPLIDASDSDSLEKSPPAQEELETVATPSFNRSSNLRSPPLFTPPFPDPDADTQSYACLSESLLLRHTNSHGFATNYLSEALKPETFNFFARASFETSELNAQYDINSELINELKHIQEQQAQLMSSTQAAATGNNNNNGLTRSVSISSVSSDLSFTSVTSSITTTTGGSSSKCSKSKSSPNSPEQESSSLLKKPRENSSPAGAGESRRSRSRSPRALPNHVDVIVKRRLSLGTDQSLGGGGGSSTPRKSQLKLSRSCSSRIS